jgi:hypothetical protein
MIKSFLAAAAALLLLAAPAAAQEIIVPSSASIAPLIVESANVVAQRNGVTPQNTYIYKSYIDASNFERLILGWNSSLSAFTVAGDKLGTGTARNLTFSGGGNVLSIGLTADANSSWTISANHFLPGITNSYDLGATASAPRDVFVARHLGTPASGGTAPTISACGTSPSLGTGGTDTAGVVTTGTATPTGCTITFGQSYTNAPTCIVVDSTALSTLTSYTVSTSAIVLTNSAASSQKMAYHCIGA